MVLVACSAFVGYLLCMKMIPSRQLSASPGKVWSLLEREGALVITRDGVPRGILLPTSEATFFEDLHDEARRRARNAVSAVRRRALAAGADAPSASEIGKEIAAVRKARTRKGR